MWDSINHNETIIFWKRSGRSNVLDVEENFQELAFNNITLNVCKILFKNIYIFINTMWIFNFLQIPGPQIHRQVVWIIRETTFTFNVSLSLKKEKKWPYPFLNNHYLLKKYFSRVERSKGEYWNNSHALSWNWKWWPLDLLFVWMQGGNALTTKWMWSIDNTLFHHYLPVVQC